MQQSGVKREGYSNKCLHYKKRGISLINSLILHLQELGKEEQTKTSVGRMKEITKSKAEI